MALSRTAAAVSRAVAGRSVAQQAVRCMSSQTVSKKTGQRKTEMLRDMFQSKDLEFIMEAHNGLSAKIVEEAGFKVCTPCRCGGLRACHSRVCTTFVCYCDTTFVTYCDAGHLGQRVVHLCRHGRA